jgi:hypothetical protein
MFCMLMPSSNIIAYIQLQRTIPTEILSQIEPDLERFGARAVEDIWELGKACERFVQTSVEILNISSSRLMVRCV